MRHSLEGSVGGLQVHAAPISGLWCSLWRSRQTGLSRGIYHVRQLRPLSLGSSGRVFGGQCLLLVTLLVTCISWLGISPHAPISAFVPCSPADLYHRASQALGGEGRRLVLLELGNACPGRLVLGELCELPQTADHEGPGLVFGPSLHPFGPSWQDAQGTQGEAGGGFSGGDFELVLTSFCTRSKSAAESCNQGAGTAPKGPGTSHPGDEPRWLQRGWGKEPAGGNTCPSWGAGTG